jgi:primosomal protein N' (replication factor Y) (superfamily II helicase)
LFSFIEVILPLPVGATFTYGVPIEYQSDIRKGMRVEVPFGKKLYAGIVAGLHNNKPEEYTTHPIRSIIDVAPIVNEIELTFWQWIAQYYMCALGDVMNAVLPAYLKLSSETGIIRNEYAIINDADLNDAEYMIMEALQLRAEITLEEAQSIVQPIPVRKVIATLIAKQAILAFESLKHAYKPKTEDVLIISEQYGEEAALQSLFNELERAPKQLHLVLSYLHLRNTVEHVSKKLVLEQSGAGPAQLTSLVDKGIFSISTRQIDRLVLVADKHYDQFVLSATQKTKLQEIQEAFKLQKTCLLHGITGSGKTNVHIKLIETYLQEGKQVLYLVPEIALTAQMINKLYSYFGEALGVYHSKYSNHERIETWQNVRTQKIKILLGARSALFLPFTSLGLIVVDEEHDGSYKQFDTVPRYHARDAALVLAQLSKANVLLSSATPSLESYRNAEHGKYALVQLQERFGNAQLPKVEIIDNRPIPHTKRQSNLLHDDLIHAMKASMQQRKQVILFQNRRGFAPYLFCSACGWHAHCKNCDVSITYHKSTDKLHCHYCATKWTVPKTCPQCRNTNIYYKNYGTERVEEEVHRVFPSAIVDRLDTDTARTKSKYQNIIRGVEKNHTQVLIGTQMVAKGLDFEHVQTVGVLSADSLFTMPDFRINEKAFQLLCQVSGRAGRQDDGGLVLIQTINVNNPYLPLVQQHNYLGFYQMELAYRREFAYPPYNKLIKITLRHAKQALVKQTAEYLAAKITLIKEVLVLGPTEAMIARKNNLYYEEILIKCGTDPSLLVFVKKHVAKMIADSSKQKGSSSVGVTVDVDPY